jgi:hypothetical protein
LQRLLHTVAGEISHLAEPLTPQKLAFNPMPEPPLNPWRSPPGTPPRDAPHGAHGAHGGAHGAAEPPPPPPPQSIDEKLQVLRARAVHM